MVEHVTRCGQLLRDAKQDVGHGGYALPVHWGYCVAVLRENGVTARLDPMRVWGGCEGQGAQS